jgi:hypothetical protein
MIEVTAGPACSSPLVVMVVAVAMVTVDLEIAAAVTAVAEEMVVVAAATKSCLGYHHVCQLFQSGRSAAW